MNPQRTRSCTGVQPLTARWEPWMDHLTSDPVRCAELIEEYGSPVHVHELSAFSRNVSELHDAARSCHTDLCIQFARKANKCSSYVDAAKSLGIGIDVASLRELEQVLERGVSPDRIIVTSAVKPRQLLEMCVEQDVCLAIDNDDEADALIEVCLERSTTARVAIRVHGFTDGQTTLDSRFGLGIDDVLDAITRWSNADRRLRVEGLHFHLDGYSAHDRVIALDRILDLAVDCRRLGEPIQFVDMGGGFPMSYLDDTDEWDRYWHRLETALHEQDEPITYRNHGFGLFAHDGKTVGTREAYPHAQTPVRGSWLTAILDAPRPSTPNQTIAQSLNALEIRLHCEPGRALLDGCGLTLAQVTHRKQVRGDWLIGLHMNSSNCRSRKSELFADPRVIATGHDDTPSMTGYLTGAYCTESDLIMHRRLEFTNGVTNNDIVAFPNTAGYLMHFVESRSHQFDLPRNVVLHPDGVELDPLDEARPLQ